MRAPMRAAFAARVGSCGDGMTPVTGRSRAPSADLGPVEQRIPGRGLARDQLLGAVGAVAQQIGVAVGGEHVGHLGVLRARPCRWRHWPCGSSASSRGSILFALRVPFRGDRLRQRAGRHDQRRLGRCPDRPAVQRDAIAVLGLRDRRPRSRTVSAAHSLMPACSQIWSAGRAAGRCRRACDHARRPQPRGGVIAPAHAERGHARGARHVHVIGRVADHHRVARRRRPSRPARRAASRDAASTGGCRPPAG